MKTYEVTSVDTGKTHVMTQKAAEQMFGKVEFKEIVAGYLPNVIAVQVS
jgi:hypothetical protein